ncbi:MFS transporter [Devosia sp. 63-57]|uniref:MFS transporter n=1 Tax=Devosia sp. 63-57 TaxID=1895751 RepID=UPI00086954A0|nr:MFS transporter [Devosia sp. 63-57]ODT50012.1 MAG: MFS transporter [Pelagibacterium sp. SCN 63-126]ODU81289.1 MAG: MFS transporter [Pelagibacterium sp. SCN 63-17]OJX45305.1 MAG: MFS transporter [Devosia sp. 63-57]
MTIATETSLAPAGGNSARRVLAASMIGTTIEFFDFYIYATAAVIVFPHLFFPAADANSALLSSLATFAIAFLARPIGAAFFGHFGDKVGRKATLVAALLTMGISTVLIGVLPTYEQIGIFAPLLLALCRLGQGLGLGGEWGGAVLLATENAPEGKRAWYGMFPQLGAPVGFFLATTIFLVLAHFLGDDAFMSWGWRVPFLASAFLVILGLFIRLKITETPEFAKAIEKAERVEVPFVDVFRRHKLSLVLGTMAALATFVLFYIMTVFSLSYGTRTLGYSREEFLILQMVGVVFFGLLIPVAAILADRYGMRRVMIGVSIGIALFGLVLAPLLGSDNVWGVLGFLCIGFALMGMTYGPLGTALAAPFPTAVRYTGASLTFNLGGIFGASFAPYIAAWLADTYGLHTVGYYIIIAAVVTLVAFGFIRQTAE